LSRQRIRAGSEFQDDGAETENARQGKISSDAGRSSQKIRVGRMQGSGWKVVGD